jgi:mono/diheme cytochrome c family protein
MTAQRRAPAFSPAVFVAATVIAGLAFGPSFFAYGQTAGSRFGAPPTPGVTPVQGPSRLKRLGLSMDSSPMGQAGTWGPASPGWQDPSPEETGDSVFVLSGRDLYRLSCQACHKPDGGGAPPDIPPLSTPVQATSAVMVREQMKARGFELPPEEVRQLTLQAQASLHERLLNGGEKMPAFGYLNGREIASLEAYLRELAGIPDSEQHQITVTERPARVGEILVKGTCHICHDATGPGVGHDMMAIMESKIPSLASLPHDLTSQEVLRKVREGLAFPIPMMTRGRMPIFTYLTPDEVHAAYQYLAQYPPQP